MQTTNISTGQVRKLIIIGCGPHFINRYSDVLIKQCPDIEIAAIIDIENRKESIVQAMATKGLRPDIFIFLEDTLRNFPNLDTLRAKLSNIPQLVGVDAALICTEPKAHFAYALWCMENGINIFMDKPITPLTSERAPELLQQDFLQLLAAQQHAGIRFVVSCERRMHIGYRYIEDFLTTFIIQYSVPITHVSIYFSGGVWLLPFELNTLENHPFKYGYGVLLHSGYHYIDLLARLAKLNETIQDFDISNPQLDLSVVKHKDISQVMKKDFYQRFGIIENIDSNDSPLNYGELDIAIIGQYQHQGNYRMGFCLQLLETSVSSRNICSDLPNTGRIRQETVQIHLGNLCSVRIVADSFRKLTNSDEPERFDISISCNPLVAEGVPTRHFNRLDLSQWEPRLPVKTSSNVFARCEQLLDFLNGGEARSPLASHANSVALLVNIYRTLREKLSAREKGTQSEIDTNT